MLGRVVALVVACACLMVPAVETAEAADPDPPRIISPHRGLADLTSVRAKVKAKDWAGAVRELVPIVETVADADAFNLLAFSLRNQGHHDAAFIYYFKALDLDPDHTSAREYLGELYVKLGQFDKAREQLDRLERLCPQGCEERDDLAAAIAKAAPPR